MCLEQKERYDESVFGSLWCIVCGCENWVEIPYEGVFCKNCNTQVQLQSSNDSNAVLADFSCESTWNLHKEELNRRELPQELVRAKLVGGPSGYEVKWWTPEPNGFWEPMERKTEEELQKQREALPEEMKHMA